MRTRLTVAALVIGAVITGYAGTQTPAPATATFEVAAIRENTSGAAGGGASVRGDRLTVTNLSARSLISMAYEISDPARILGGPDWVDAVRYDINALGSLGLTWAQATPMLRSLLRERFQLGARIEQRDLPAYALVRMRTDGSLGPGLRPSIDCEDPQARAAAGAQGLATCRRGISFGGPGVVNAGGIRIQSLANVLTSAAGRPVFDKTGLTGGFDLELRWTAGLGPDSPQADSVSIFTAVQEQLGLRLQSTTAPLDVVVVERIQRPSEN